MKGHSSSGKSFTVEQTVRYFPPEAVVEMTAMTERALVYSTEEYTHRTLVMYEVVALREGVEDNLTAYFVRSLLSEGRIEYAVTVRDKDGGFTTKTIVKEGPTNLVFTTTKIRSTPRTKPGCCRSPPTTAATRRPGAARARRRDRRRPATWANGMTCNGGSPATASAGSPSPTPAKLAELVPPVAVRLRRDFGALLALIRAHAILHQQNRERDDRRAHHRHLDDYEVVRDLVEDVIAEGVGATVPEIVRETVEAVDALAPDPEQGVMARPSPRSCRSTSRPQPAAAPGRRRRLHPQPRGQARASRAGG